MLIVLSGSFEFWKQYNNEIIERETDNLDLPRYFVRKSPIHANSNDKRKSLN